MPCLVKPSPARLVPAKPAQTSSVNKHTVSVDIDDMPGLVDSEEDDDAVRSKPVKSGFTQKPSAAKPVTGKVTAPSKVSALPKVAAPPAKVAVTAKPTKDEEPPPLVEYADKFINFSSFILSQYSDSMIHPNILDWFVFMCSIFKNFYISEACELCIGNIFYTPKLLIGLCHHHDWFTLMYQSL